MNMCQTASVLTGLVPHFSQILCDIGSLIIQWVLVHKWKRLAVLRIWVGKTLQRVSINHKKDCLLHFDLGSTGALRQNFESASAALCLLPSLRWCLAEKTVNVSVPLVPLPAWLRRVHGSWIDTTQVLYPPSGHFWALSSSISWWNSACNTLTVCRTVPSRFKLPLTWAIELIFPLSFSRHLPMIPLKNLAQILLSIQGTCYCWTGGTHMYLPCCSNTFLIFSGCC